VSDLGTPDRGGAVRRDGRTGWKVGDTIGTEFAETGKHTMKVVGIYDSKGPGQRRLRHQHRRSDRGGRSAADHSGLVTSCPAPTGRRPEGDHRGPGQPPDAKVLDRKGSRKEASGFIDKLLTFVTVMLLLAVIIALLGIVTTLVLSVFERTRERACAGRSA
jgi:putative ABC transport system permease protein